MAREIKVTIRQDGTMVHEVNGVVGQGCFDFAKPLEEATDQAVFEQDAGESTAQFRIRVDLLETRELVATNLTTGQKFGMVLEKEAWISKENPFAGIH